MKPDCYKCTHRGNVPGNTHSCCRYPGNKSDMFDMFEPANRENAAKLNIRADAHGVKMGWFCWPVNFDPAWLLNCDGFENIKPATGLSEHMDEHAERMED